MKSWAFLLTTVYCLLATSPAISQPLCGPQGCPPQFGAPRRPEVINPPHRAPWPTEDGRPAISDTVVQIRGPESCGSGVNVCVTDGQVHTLTAYHVIENQATLVLTYPGGERCPAKIEGVDRANDLALLVSSPKGTPHWSFIAQDLPSAGTKIWKVGYPGHAELQEDVQTGKLIECAGSTARYDCPFRPGDSGGGVFGENGHVLGIVSTFRPDRYSEGRAVCLKPIHALMLKLGLPARGGKQSAGQRPQPQRRQSPKEDMPPSGGGEDEQKPDPKNKPAPPRIPHLDTDQVDKILKELQELKDRKQLAGPPGERGPAGPAGPTGPNGSTPDVEPLVAPLRKKLGEFGDDVDRRFGDVKKEINPLHRRLDVIEDGVGRLHDLKKDVGDVNERVDQVGIVIQKFSTLAGWTGWMPLITALAGGGGLTGGVLIAGVLWRFVKKRLAAKAGPSLLRWLPTIGAVAGGGGAAGLAGKLLWGYLQSRMKAKPSTTGPSGADALQGILAQLARDAAAIAARSGKTTPPFVAPPAGPPPPTNEPAPPPIAPVVAGDLPQTNTQFVAVPQADRRYEALMEAVALTTKKFPETVGAWRHIEAVAQQIYGAAK